MSAEIIEHPGRRRVPEHDVERSPARFWMKHDIKAFAFETATADAEGAGALILLRGHYFITGSLPKTDAECSKVCRLSARKFARIRPWLFSFFDADGRSLELDASIEETKRFIETRRAAGQKGGAGKALARAKQTGWQNPSQSQSQSQSQSEIQEEPESSAASPPAPPPLPVLRAREADEIAAQALAFLPVSARAHPGWCGLSAWIGRLLGDGIDRADIVVGISQCLRSLKDQPPSTFGYFNAAIERAREARMAPLPEVTPRRDPTQHDLGAAGEILRKRLGNEVFASWFGGATLLGVRGGDTVEIRVATAFIRSRIIRDFEADCIAAFNQVHPFVVRMAVSVADGVRS